MSKPAVSVVLVVCNVERFLGEAIESILGQTFREFEFIIVDFGSTDRSEAIVSSYAVKDSRVRLHEIPHCGLAEARNAGCFLARGQYIAIMDADDVSLPERLMWEVEFLEKNPKVGVVGGAVDWIDATGTILANAVPPLGVTLRPVAGNREIQSALVISNTIWQPSVLMRKEAFDFVGGYRPAFAPTEDYDLWLRISEHFEMANLNQVILKYRIHPYQVSIRKRKQQTLCAIAALASASSRRNGSPDPLNSGEQITPAVLVGLGISEAKQQTALAAEYRGWIRSLCGAGEWSGALNAALEMLKSSDWKHLERRTIADMLLEVARLYWKNHRYWKGILTVGHAVITRPRVAGRPSKTIALLASVRRVIGGRLLECTPRLRHRNRGQFSGGELMPKNRVARAFGREFKVMAVRRMMGAENTSGLARELKVLRKDLYRWRDQFRKRGAEGFRPRGRPRQQGRWPAEEGSQAGAPAAASRGNPVGPEEELGRAKARIAELFQTVGRQQMELDFFRKALRQVRASSRTSGAPGVLSPRQTWLPDAAFSEIGKILINRRAYAEAQAEALGNAREYYANGTNLDLGATFFGRLLRSEPVAKGA